MGYWNWLWNKIRGIKNNLACPFAEFLYGGFIVILGTFLLYELLREFTTIIILRSLLIMILGSLVMAHGWYRQWSS